MANKNVYTKTESLCCVPGKHCIVGQLYFNNNQITKSQKKIIFVVTRGGGIGAEEIG